MSAATAFGKVDATINRWFMTPEKNAAGRMGLFRILFGAFYLWHLSSHFATVLGGIPENHRNRLLLEGSIAAIPMSPQFLSIVESALVAALVMLMIGYRTRLVTAAVLVLGVFLEARFIDVQTEHATVLLIFHIPLLMLFFGDWGGTYSLDSLSRHRAGLPVAEPGDSSWTYILPARAALVVLSALFFSAAALKIVGGRWVPGNGLFANVMLEKNVESALLGLSLNPFAPLLSSMPGIADALGYLMILFEGTFFLALFSRRLLYFYVPIALIFHSLSALWLLVTFTPILVVYALFIDWQALRERLWNCRVRVIDGISTWILTWAALAVSATTGIVWNAGTVLRDVVNLNGFLNWRSVWYPTLFLAVAWLMFVVAKRLVATISRPAATK